MTLEERVKKRGGGEAQVIMKGRRGKKDIEE